jgi:hypothetical protein
MRIIRQKPIELNRVTARSLEGKRLDVEVLRDIPFSFSKELFYREIRISAQDEMCSSVEDLLKRALPLTRPKGLFKVAYIESREMPSIKIDGITFRSEVLCENLKKVERVFPFIATCGRELDGLDLSSDDFLAPYWLDSLKAMALAASRDFLRQRLDELYGLNLEKLVTMNPGSADREVWPIEQQKELFSLFGDVEELIGVRLTDSFLMIPNKSVSGIFFETEVSWVSCQLCTREICPNRKAPYKVR